MSAKILSVISQKGGVAKSMTVRQLGVAAALDKMKTLLIDMDPQGTLIAWDRRRSKILGERRAPLVVGCNDDLSELVEKYKTKTSLILVDTKPETNDQTAKAAQLSDAILIPIQPSVDDIVALRRTVDLVKMTGKPAFLIVTKAPSQIGEIHAVQAGLAAYDLPIWDGWIGERKIHRQAAGKGLSAQEMKQSSKAAQAATAEIQALWKWVKNNILINQ